MLGQTKFRVSGLGYRPPGKETWLRSRCARPSLAVEGKQIVKCFKILTIGGGFFGGQIEQNSFLDTSGQNEGHFSITLCNIDIFLETKVPN